MNQLLPLIAMRPMTLLSSERSNVSVRLLLQSSLRNVFCLTITVSRARWPYHQVLLRAVIVFRSTSRECVSTPAFAIDHPRYALRNTHRKRTRRTFLNANVTRSALSPISTTAAVQINLSYSSHHYALQVQKIVTWYLHQTLGTDRSKMPLHN